MNLASSKLLLRVVNMVDCEESTSLNADSVSTASCFQMKLLENSFAPPMYKSSGGAVSKMQNTDLFASYNYYNSYILFSTMEFGSWKSVINVFSSFFDSTAASVLPSFPSSIVTRDTSIISPLIPAKLQVCE